MLLRAAALLVLVGSGEGNRVDGFVRRECRVWRAVESRAQGVSVRGGGKGNVTELYLMTTTDCPVCGWKVECHCLGKMFGGFGARLKAKDINTGVRRQQHLGCFGVMDAEVRTEAFDVPEGCLFAWREESC